MALVSSTAKPTCGQRRCSLNFLEKCSKPPRVYVLRSHACTQTTLLKPLIEKARIRREQYVHVSTYSLQFLPHQQVGQQDWHDNEEDDPEDVGHYWEGGQQVAAFVAVAKYCVILKLPNGHHHGFDEGEASIPKGGDIHKQSSIFQL